MADATPIRASIALVAYAEALVEGRRAIVFGEATGGLADRLIERGARLVHVYDPDPSRVAEAASRNTTRNITFAPLSEGDLSIRDASFDVALVENLAGLPDPGGLLRRVKRTLSSRGVALVATPNAEVKHRLLPPDPGGETIGYYELFDLVAEQFEHVTMIGQAPFVGYALAAFAPEGEPAPTFDTGFVPGGAEEPEWFVALVADHAPRVEPFAIVQLPSRWAVRDTSARYPRARRQADAASERKLADLERELAQREAWIQQLEQRATTADARADDAEERLEQLSQKARTATSDRDKEQARRLESKLEESRARATKLQEQLRAAQEELRAEREQRQAAQEKLRAEQEQRQAAQEKLRAEQEQRRVTQEKLRAEPERLRAAQEEIRTEREQRRRLEQELAQHGAADDGHAQRAQQLEQRCRELEERLEGFDEIEKQAAADLGTLEEQLRVQAAGLRTLEEELSEARRTGKELVYELDSRPATSDAALREKLDRLAIVNAEREGDLAAARYHIEQLRSELQQSAKAHAEHDQLASRLDEAHAKLQAQAALLGQQSGSAATAKE